MQATGLRNNGTTVVQVLPYNPGLLGTKMKFTTFPASDFSDLISLAIQVIQGAEPTDGIDHLFDNSHYLAYSES